MDYVNARMRQAKPSGTLAVKAKAEEFKAKGISITDLGAGEPDVDTPEHIKEAAYKALKDGKTKYTVVAGIKPLREAIAKKLTTENGIPTTFDQVVVSNGGKQSLFNAMAVCLEPGDEVIIPAPYWVSYPAMVELNGGRSVIVNTSPESGYRMNPEELKAALTPKTKMVILNSPSNPTGAGYTREDFVKLGKVLADSKALIVSDEVYERIVYAPFAFSSFANAVPELASRTITVNSFSKSYAMTGWRVGYAAAPKPIAVAMDTYQGQVTTNVNTIAQYASLAALEGSQDFFDPLVARYRARTQRAFDKINASNVLSVPAFPDGAFYLFIRIEEVLKRSKKITGSAAMCTFLMEYARVAVVPGDAFGDDNAFRISVAASDSDVDGGVERICQAVAEL